MAELSAESPTQRGARLALAGIVLCGAAIRLAYIGRESLWFDEALSCFFSRLPIGELWGSVPAYETHPPLYYTLLKAWSALFGDSETALRSLSALAGTATIPLIYMLGRITGGEARGRMAGLFSAAIFAMAPGQIFHSQEARPYPFLVMAASLALLGAMRLAAEPRLAIIPFLGFGSAGEQGEEKRSSAVFSWAALIIGTALTLWFHNMGFTLALALLSTAGAGLLWRNGFSRSYTLNAALAAGVVLFIYGPFIPWLFKQAGTVRSSFWQQYMDLSVVGAGFEYVFFAFMYPVWIKALTLGLAGYGLNVIYRERGALLAATLAGAMLVPFILVIGISYLYAPIFVSRTLLWAGVPFYLMAGAALAAEYRLAVKAPLIALTAIGLIQGDFAQTMHWKESWRALAKMMAQEAKPGDVILVLPNSAAIPFSYYSVRHMPRMKIVPLPAPFPAPGLDRPYPTGNAAEPAFTMADAGMLDNVDCQRGSVWLVARFLPMYDPEKAVTRALLGRCELAKSAGDAGMAVYKFTAKKSP